MDYNTAVKNEWMMSTTTMGGKQEWYKNKINSHKFTQALQICKIKQSTFGKYM